MAKDERKPMFTLDFAVRGDGYDPFRRALEGSFREMEQLPVDSLRRELETARRMNEEFKRLFESLNTSPSTHVIVIGKGEKPGRWLVRRGAETLEVSGEAPGIAVGATVRCLTQTMNILSAVSTDAPAAGDLVKVVRVASSSACEVAAGIGTRAVLSGRHTVAAGDRVVLDPTGSAVVANYGPEPAPQVVAAESSVTWEDIGGQDEAKAAMREAIEGPVLRRAIYARYGRRPTKGVLLYGPPGNGKTMLGKAAATALAALHGASAGASGFLYVKGPELLNMYVGASEQNVRQLFESARRHKAQHGYPALIFIDEAEALLGKRGGGVGAALAGVLTSTIVPMFLAEMDGIVESGALVILATNRPDALDPAVVREGRIDRKVRVGRPDREDAIAIFRRHLAGRPLAADVDVELLAVAGVAALYDTAHVLYRVHRADGVPKSVTLGHLTSGAQIAHLVDLGATLALERELAGGAPGMATEDLEIAVRNTLEEQRHIDHVDELLFFVEPFKKQLKEIERVTARAVGGGN